VPLHLGFISKPIRREKLVDVMEEVATWVAEGRDPGYETTQVLIMD
jgi:hypothetical protein